ncbi:hypothetical protein LXL04_017527 [Taraxacum kok-saghyz]
MMNTRSTGGMTFYFNDNFVTWALQKRKCVALSSCEAESTIDLVNKPFFHKIQPIDTKCNFIRKCAEKEVISNEQKYLHGVIDAPEVHKDTRAIRCEEY